MGTYSTTIYLNNSVQMLTRSHSNTKEIQTPTEQEPKMSAKEDPPTIVDLMKEICQGNKKTEEQLGEMDKTLKDNKKLLEDYISKNDATVNQLRSELDHSKTEVSTLQATVKELKGAVNTLTEEFRQTQSAVKQQNTVVNKLEKVEKTRDEEKRRSNIIIEGLKEDDRIHPRQQVGSLMADIGVIFTPENIPTVTRLGPMGRKGRKPRPILVKFSSYFYKQEIFKNISKLKDNQKWKGTIIQDDLPQEEIARRRDLRCLSALAKEKGHTSSVRGGSLIINDQRYGYRDLSKLPEGISMENAKLVEVEGGWAFQGHHAFLSTMYPCNIKHDGHDFHCSEQVYY